MTGETEIGLGAIKRALRTMPSGPGVYRMVSAKGEVLYVGKARDLKKRVASYARPTALERRKLAMVAETASMVVVTTRTEAEALLLEANLIKHYRTRYNVLLRDDKSFPHILIPTDHDFPQIAKHRGARKLKGRYFGPFASVGAVNQTLNSLQRVFLLRNCADSVFENRSRPCLLHQIKRCSAPCVGRISASDYAKSVEDAIAFLEGRSTGIQKQLAAAMHQEAEALRFEQAASLRDRLRALTQVQARQEFQLEGNEDADVIAVAQKGGASAIQIFFLRGGQNWGGRAYFPRHDASATPTDVLTAFLSQFYENKPAARQVLLSTEIDEADLVAEALSLRAPHKVRIGVPQRGDKKRVVDFAARNAVEALDRHLAEAGSQRRWLEGLAEWFELEAPPARIEVYDNSHVMGTHAVGAMIVAGPEGFVKNAYRKFNIKGVDITPGDDFGMMREVMTRRFGRLAADTEASEWPDLVLIDGGEGQLSAVRGVLAELGIADDVALVGIAKGEDRNAGRETFHRTGHPPLSFPENHPVLFFLQRLRDEAHRFAIGSHRARRAKAMLRSPLDEVAGVGAKRKRALLNHFGSARAVSNAGITELIAVDGISRAIAETIYDHFHGQAGARG